MADSLIAWQTATGHKAVFWGANVHVAAADQVEYAFPPTVQTARLVPVGHWLHARYGAGYVAIGALFGSGQVLQGFETGQPRVYDVPPPRPGTLDDLLSQARPDPLLLDLRAPAEELVQAWLSGPTTLRLIGSAYDAATDDRYAMTVPSLTGAFDALVFLEHTGPARLLA